MSLTGRCRICRCFDKLVLHVLAYTLLTSSGHTNHVRAPAEDGVHVRNRFRPFTWTPAFAADRGLFYSTACASAGSLHTSTGLRAARVSSSRRRGAKCGAVLRLSSPAFARAATLRSAPMN